MAKTRATEVCGDSSPSQGRQLFSAASAAFGWTYWASILPPAKLLK